MKQILLIVLSIIALGCTNPHTFILNDMEANKYFITETINQAFKKDQIDKSPLIVINGVLFEYNKTQDTILLPLKKSDIISLDFLNKNSSRIIYNEKENDGAVIITTKIKNE
ncbi:hypothetical protein IUY40_05805 [Flavobacterium sp. ALJ2]|uniref:hypothetical protein n=1 Tax=Flavobacterium sp. ALJ2 TaxID=2786960 RepID=UPI00189F814D|nr:hypothetical protein [Flavobacterium sp. ALJ2]MBF7091049.1 hypothetical protein [Flavobacterium sp. ALJ2]